MTNEKETWLGQGLETRLVDSNRDLTFTHIREISAENIEAKFISHKASNEGISFSAIRHSLDTGIRHDRLATSGAVPVSGPQRFSLNCCNQDILSNSSANGS